MRKNLRDHWLGRQAQQVLWHLTQWAQWHSPVARSSPLLFFIHPSFPLARPEVKLSRLTSRKSIMSGFSL